MSMMGEGPTSEGGMGDSSPANSGYDPTVDPQMEDDDDNFSTEHPLNARQCALEEAIEGIAETFGMFEQDGGPNGARYEAESSFAADGIVCGNCAFYCGTRACEVVKGDIDPGGACKLWIIPADLAARSDKPTTLSPNASYIVRAWDSPDAASLRSASDGAQVMIGHFAVFDTWTEINSRNEGQFLERIAPSAFNDTLAKRAKSIRVLFDHGADPTIGNKPLGEPNVMRSDKTGVYYEVSLFDTPYVNDLLPALRAGQLGASFRMRVTGEYWDYPTRSSDRNKNMLPERTITQIELYEFGPVVFPAYGDATAGLRSRTDWFVNEMLNDTAFVARFVERIGASNFEAIRSSLPPVADRESVATPVERGAAGVTEPTTTPVQDRKRLVAARYAKHPLKGV